MNKNIKLILISVAVLALIGAEFYLLLSTKMQVGDIKTKVVEIESRINKQNDNNSYKSKDGQSNISLNKAQKRASEIRQKEVVEKQNNTTTYTSQKLESPDSDKAFFFESKKIDIENKKIDRKTDWGNYYFAFNGDTRFYINGYENKDGELESNIHPKIELSSGSIKNITKYLGNFSCMLGGVEVMDWYDNNSLLLGCRSGDAGHLWMDLWVVNINDGNSNNLMSCRYSSSFGSKDSSSLSHCVHDDIVYIQECNSIDNSSFKTDCNKASVFQEEEKIDIDKLGGINERKKWAKQIMQEADKIDGIITDIDFSSFDETDEFNIKNAGNKFKIKGGEENKKSLIWNLDTGKLTKIN